MPFASWSAIGGAVFGGASSHRRSAALGAVVVFCVEPEPPQPASIATSREHGSARAHGASTRSAPSTVRRRDRREAARDRPGTCSRRPRGTACPTHSSHSAFVPVIRSDSGSGRRIDAPARSWTRSHGSKSSPSSRRQRGVPLDRRQRVALLPVRPHRRDQRRQAVRAADVGHRLRARRAQSAALQAPRHLDDHCAEHVRRRLRRCRARSRRRCRRGDRRASRPSEPEAAGAGEDLFVVVDEVELELRVPR